VPNTTQASGSASWRDVVAVAVVVALLAAAVPGANAVRAAWQVGPASRGHGVVQVLVDALAVVLAVAAAVVTMVAAMTVLWRRRRLNEDSGRVWQEPIRAPWTRAGLVTLVLFASAAPFLALAMVRRFPTHQSAPTVASTGVVSSTPPGGAGGPAAGPSHGGLLLVAGLGLVALLLLILIGGRAARRRTRVPAPALRQAPATPSTAEALAAASHAGAEALSGQDPRTAVLRCYAAMAEALRRVGVAGRAAEVPSELLARAAATGMVPAAPASELTDLFGEAQFSSHPFTETQRQAATVALERIRRALAGAP
jgi:Domain of unknown function (DUF4129)